MAARGRSKQTAQQRMPPSLCSNLSDLGSILSPALKRFLTGSSLLPWRSSLVGSVSSEPETALPVPSAILLVFCGDAVCFEPDERNDGTSCSIYVTFLLSNRTAESVSRGFARPVTNRLEELRKVFPLRCLLADVLAFQGGSRQVDHCVHCHADGGVVSSWISDLAG